MKRKIASTHSCLSFMLIFAQCFGMLPVSGITKEDCSCLKFNWTLKRTTYSLIFALGAGFNSICQILKMVRAETVSFGYCVTLLFFSVTFITVVIFIDVARKWPALMRKWSEVDIAMSSYGFPFGLHKKLKFIAFIIMSGAIVEHSLFLAFMIKYGERGDSFMDTVRLYFEHSFDQIFTIISYNIFWGVLVQILNTFSTISWNFMDLFIILISLCLSTRFTQVVKNISALTKKKKTNENTWRKLREDYTRLSVLCRIVDDAISNIILVSFGNNIYVVLVQLFYSLQRPSSDGVLDKVYYVYSFIFLITRTIAVALYAATISSESKKPTYYLNMFSHRVYNVEVERLIYQTKYGTAALTGRKLFKVTNTLILSVAGAIVTYELVMLQFQVA